MATIDESNFRECAQDAIKKYREGGKLIDALVWGTIIGLYESALASSLKATAIRLQSYPSDPRGTCPGCGDKALDGKVTCGRVECGTSPIRVEFLRVLDTLEADGQCEAICVCGHSVFQHADGVGLAECFADDCGCLDCHDAEGKPIRRS